MRTPDGLSARNVTLSVRLTRSAAAALDRQRGSDSRSQYIRRLIQADGRMKSPDRKQES